METYDNQSKSIEILSNRNIKKNEKSINVSKTCRDEAVTNTTFHFSSSDEENFNDFKSSTTGSEESLELEEKYEKIEKPKKRNWFLEFISLQTLLNVITEMDNDELLRQKRIVIDLRECRLYQNSHFRYAVNANCRTKMMVKRSIAQWLQLAIPYEKFDANKPIDVYLYDRNSSENEPFNPIVKLFVDFILNRGHKVFMLNGGLSDHDKRSNLEGYVESTIDEALLKEYKCSPTNKDTCSLDVFNAELSQINSNIWLGNERDAKDHELLNSLGIKNVLNVTGNIPNFFENERSMNYCRLTATDSHDQNLLQHFNEGSEFINEVCKRNEKVLVHCWAGVSRSPTVILSYFIRYKGLSVKEALMKVQSKRNIVAPNLNFMGQLERYAMQCVDRNDSI